MTAHGCSPWPHTGRMDVPIRARVRGRWMKVGACPTIEVPVARYGPEYGPELLKMHNNYVKVCRASEVI